MNKRKYSKRKYSKRKYSKRKYSKRKYSKRKDSKRKYSKKRKYNKKKKIGGGTAGQDRHLSTPGKESDDAVGWWTDVEEGLDDLEALAEEEPGEGEANKEFDLTAALAVAAARERGRAILAEKHPREGDIQSKINELKEVRKYLLYLNQKTEFLKINKILQYGNSHDIDRLYNEWMATGADGRTQLSVLASLAQKAKDREEEKQGYGTPFREAPPLPQRNLRLELQQEEILRKNGYEEILDADKDELLELCEENKVDRKKANEEYEKTGEQGMRILILKQMDLESVLYGAI